jgi:hypothetical protein
MQEEYIETSGVRRVTMPAMHHDPNDHGMIIVVWPRLLYPSF